jgi:hypothetical protein
MPPRERMRQEPDRADESASRRDARVPTNIEADDRGGSRDGERLEPGDPGDREQLDNDGGRKPMK